MYFPIDVTDHMLVCIVFPVVLNTRGEYLNEPFRGHNNECSDRFERSIYDVEKAVYLVFGNTLCHE